MADLIGGLSLIAFFALVSLLGSIPGEIGETVVYLVTGDDGNE